MKLYRLLQEPRVYVVALAALALALVCVAQPIQVAKAGSPDQSQMVGKNGKTFTAPDAGEKLAEAFSGSGNVSGLSAEDLIADSRRLSPLLPPIGPSSVIGSDGRKKVTNTTTYPYRANAFLEVDFPSGGGTCTGWFVGPRTLVTAGHCVYDVDFNEWADSIKVYPGRNGNSTPYGSAYACFLWSVNGWVNSENTNYDYGAIILSPSDDLGNTVGWYGYFWTSDGNSLDEDLVRIYGYPGDKSYGTQWGMQNRIKQVATRKLFHNVDTAGGQSGSAVYETRSNGPYANSIHTNGVYGSSPYNRSTRITKDVFNNIKSWKNNPDCSP